MKVLFLVLLSAIALQQPARQDDEVEISIQMIKCPKDLRIIGENGMLAKLPASAEVLAEITVGGPINSRGLTAAAKCSTAVMRVSAEVFEGEQGKIAASIDVRCVHLPSAKLEEARMLAASNPVVVNSGESRVIAGVVEGGKAICLVVTVVRKKAKPAPK